jgi:hypothetical protein
MAKELSELPQPTVEYAIKQAKRRCSFVKLRCLFKYAGEYRPPDREEGEGYLTWLHGLTDEQKAEYRENARQFWQEDAKKLRIKGIQ